MSKEAYCPGPAYARAKLRVEGVLSGEGEVVSNPLLMVTEEKEGGLTGVGRFEELVAEGAGAGIYLDGLQMPLRFPLRLQKLPEPEPPAQNPIGLRIAAEGFFSVRQMYGMPRRIGWMEVAPVFPPRSGSESETR